MNRDQGWHNDRSHLIPYNDRGGFRGNRGRGDRGGFRGGRGRGRGDRGRGRGRGQNYQFGRYEAFHYRSKGPKQQAPVEHYFKNTMLEDPWAECTPVPVSEVAKKVQVSTRHRYRLFQRLDQTEDNDGLLDDEEPVDKKIKIEKEDGEGPEGDVDNPDEIEIGSSDEDEDKKPKKKEEEVEPEDEEEDVDNWEAYDPKHDPNLEDFDPGEIQEHRYGNRSDTY